MMAVLNMEMSPLSSLFSISSVVKLLFVILIFLAATLTYFRYGMRFAETYPKLLLIFP